MYASIHRIHSATIEGVKRICSDAHDRNRFIGGALITSLVVALLVLVFPLVYVSIHGVFDYEFIGDHFFAVVSLIWFVYATSFIFFVLACFRIVEWLVAKKNPEVARGLRHVILLGGMSGFVGLMFSDALRGDGILFAYGLTSILFAALLLVRWYIKDAIVSNYLTAASGVVGVLVVLSFPATAGRMYRDFVLLPKGVAGFKVDLEFESKSIKDVCLILLGPRTVWFFSDTRLQAVSREKALLSLPTPKQRRKAHCDTMASVP
jgi:hypothetical protein